jgi:predicted amidophosphoribosyltransferase
MSDDLLNFEEHRRRRDEDANTVRCARCGEWIPATASRCPECEVNFQGEAQDFIHPSEQSTAKRRPAWVVVVVVLLLAALVFAALR